MGTDTPENSEAFKKFMALQKVSVDMLGDDDVTDEPDECPYCGYCCTNPTCEAAFNRGRASYKDELASERARLKSALEESAELMTRLGVAFNPARYALACLYPTDHRAPDDPKFGPPNPPRLRNPEVS